MPHNLCQSVSDLSSFIQGEDIIEMNKKTKYNGVPINYTKSVSRASSMRRVENCRFCQARKRVGIYLRPVISEIVEQACSRFLSPSSVVVSLLHGINSCRAWPPRILCLLNIICLTSKQALHRLYFLFAFSLSCLKHFSREVSPIRSGNRRVNSSLKM